jgi:hypothetical protein
MGGDQGDAHDLAKGGLEALVIHGAAVHERAIHIEDDDHGAGAWQSDGSDNFMA